MFRKTLTVFCIVGLLFSVGLLIWSCLPYRFGLQRIGVAVDNERLHGSYYEVLLQPMKIRWQKIPISIFGRFGPAHSFPLWVVPLPFALALFLTFPPPQYRRHRRRKLGLCVKCGHDLRGLTQLLCPECGNEFEK